MNDKSLYISFGPVQSYVTEARTTRDLWAGSSLLSLLARNALVAAALRGAEPISPVLPADSSGTAKNRRGQDSVPNVMQLECSRVPPKDAARTMTDRWTQLWKAVCDSAHRVLRDASERESSEYTDEIWTRQTGQAWYSMWSAGDYQSLQMRKSIRDFNINPEPGWKCTICGKRQALTHGDVSYAESDAMWVALRRNLAGQAIRVARTERLCALCFVKRVLPILVRLGRPSELTSLSDEAFPSTVNFASVYRLDQIISSDRSELATAAIRMLDTLKSCSAERVQPLSIMGKQTRDRPSIHLLDYNGNYFYESNYQAGRFEDHTPEQTSRLRDALRDLYDACEKVQIPRPSAYYSVLLTDGDDMGKILSENEDKKREISVALGEFARNTYDIVESSAGRVVYAGGDDLLAFLPLETALSTVLRLRSAYADAMKSLALSCSYPTISAGMTFANMSMPLRQMVENSHRLLDNVAKKHKSDGHKKDAFALQVWDRTGPSIGLVKHWDAPSGTTWPQELERMVSSARRESDVPLTGGFLIRASDLIDRLAEVRTSEEPDSFLTNLLSADYFGGRIEAVASLRETAEGREKVKNLMRSIVEISKTDTGKGPEVMYNKDAPLMVRFLAGGGVRQ